MVKIDSFGSTELVEACCLIMAALFFRIGVHCIKNFGSGLGCHEEFYLTISKLTMTVLRND